MKTEEKKIKVFIVGAGPGDPGLVTLRAIESIKRADLILYDRLISRDILRYRKPGCILQYVGKKKKDHTMSQDEINGLILKHAKGKNIVVRLKGGDPFIFGRGLEEVLFLARHGIRCEVVPGVSSFYSVPESSGIPLTHRGFSSAFLVVTGHEDPEKDSSSVDWKQLAQFKGTLVILMGKSNLGTICSRLINYGMDKETPCAVISHGTMRHQELTAGIVCNIADRSRHLPAPSVVVIGDVVNLRLKPPAKPLFKKRFLSTASKRLNKDIARGLRRLGASVDYAPMIKILPNKDYSLLDTIISDVEKFDWLVFTSRHGAVYFLRRFYELGADKKDLNGKIACVGSGTENEFKRHGIYPSLIPEKFTTEELVLALKAKGVFGKNIALLRTRLKRDILKDMLISAGAEITDCIVYNTERPDNSRVLQKAVSKSPDGILFLSPNSVEHFFKQVPAKAKDSLEKKSLFFSIGPVTTRALKREGINRVFSPQEHTKEALIDLCVKVAR